MSKESRQALILLLAGLLTLVGVTQLIRNARAEPAQPKPGLWWESSAAADYVRVRRLRDTTNNTVCYVATAGDMARQIAISCVTP